jgi:hypothetical protein
MSQEQELQAIERRERRIDEALKETFPASDPPAFVGGGAPMPTGDKTPSDKPALDRVNIRDTFELQGWCAYWGCTSVELKEAVQDVGVMAANVAIQLQARGHKRQ